MPDLALTGNFEEHLPWNRLRRAMLRAGLGLWRLTAGDGGQATIMVNDGFLKMLGLDERRFPRPYDDYLKTLVHPDDAEAVARRFSGINEQNPAFEIRHRLLNQKTGEWLWFKVSGEADLFDAVGRVLAASGCLVDIHEETTLREKLKAGQAALATEYKRLDALVTAADLIAWDWDLTTEQVRYGDSLTPMGVVNLGEARSISERWGGVMTPEDQQVVLEARRRYLSGETPLYEAEVRIRRPFNDRLIWVRDRGKAVEWDEEGRPTRMMGTAVNISQYKEALESLDHSRRELERVVRTAGVAIWQWDVDNDDLILNDVYTRLLGLEPGELNGSARAWFDLLHPDDLASARTAVSDLLNGGQESTPAELRLRHKDGHYIWVYGVGRVAGHDETGRVSRLAGIQLDFTDKKNMEEAQSNSLAVISSQKRALERQITERNLLLDDIHLQVEKIMSAPGSRLDLTQKSLRKEMAGLQAELSSGRAESDGAFGRYMNLAFRFITNELVWYKAVLDSLPFPTSVFDLTKHWTYLNPPAARAMDGQVSGFIGRHYREGWKYFRDSEVVFQEGRAGKKSFIRHLPDGGQFFYCQSSILLDETGRAIGLIETMQDITAAHEADERMRVMLDANPLACSFFDRDGSLIDCNREAALLCGVSSKQEYVRRFYELMPPAQPDGRETRAVVLEAIRQAFDTGRSHLRVLLWTVDGDEVPGEVQLTRVEWRDGYTVLGYCRDLRPLIAAQTELDRERLLLRDILNGCPVPFSISQDSLVKFVTPYTKKVLGLDVGGDLYRLLPDKDDLAGLKEEMSGGRPVNWRPLRVTRADGSLAETLINAYAADYEGRLSTMAWMMDVTKLRENERELEIARDQAEASTRAKSEFLANISHEIRTPMNAVIGLTHLLSQTELTGQQRDYLAKSDSAAKSLLHLINDVLDFSKIESGKFSMAPREFRLSDVLGRAVDLVTGPAGEKGLEFTVAVAPETPDGLIGDDQRLLQVLGNLTGNAAKFTDQGEISLTVEVAALNDDEVTLRFLVRDTGIGLDDKLLSRVFSAFTQGDNSATRRYGGTGLGLTISKRLVEMMGGEIWCESRPGQGSLFGFTAAFGRHHHEVRYVERRTDFAGLSALAVDDNAAALIILKTYLEALGFEVAAAASGRAAIDLAAEMNGQKKRLDLLVVDWKMPAMDGLETARRIFEITAPVHEPTAVMTAAHCGEKITARAAAMGIKAVLPKPLLPEPLYLALSSLLIEPKPQPAQKPAQAADAAALVAHLAGAYILLVEDNEVNQLVARKILKKAGFKVAVAANGRQAVEMTAAGNFDLVLMDIQMPVMDGLTAAREIRKNPRLADLPIVAMTAHALAQDREKSLEAGMNDHICKPLDINELFRCLARWIHPLPWR